MPDRRAFVQDRASCCFQLPDHGTGAVARCLYNPDPAVDDCPGVGGVIGWVQSGEQGDVYPEGLGREFAAFGDFGGQVRRGGLCQGCYLQEHEGINWMVCVSGETRSRPAWMGSFSGLNFYFDLILSGERKGDTHRKANEQKISER